MIEGMWEIFGEDGWVFFCILGIFVQYFDVVVQWNGVDCLFGVVGLMVDMVEQYFVKVNGKLEYFYVVYMCDVVVVQFVNDDQYCDCKDKC